MIRVNVRNFPNIDEKWRICKVCGGITNDGVRADGGRLHPESEMSKYKGDWYCNAHFNFRFKKEWEDEAEIHIEEESDE